MDSRKRHKGQYVGAAGTQQAQANTANNSLNWPSIVLLMCRIIRTSFDRAIEAATRPQTRSDDAEGYSKPAVQHNSKGLMAGARQGITESLGLQKACKPSATMSAQMGSEAYGPVSI